MLTALVSAATALPGVVAGKNALAFLNSLVDQIDAVVSEQLNQVVHQPDLLKLEGTYRGLHKLLNETDTGKTLWVEMLDADRQEIVDDLAADDFTQTALYSQVHDNRYDQNGAKPVGAVVSGFSFGPDDVGSLANAARIGRAVNAPFVFSADPSVLMLDSFEQLRRVGDISAVFESADYDRWNALRRRPEARFVALAMPRVLARKPYTGEDGSGYREVPTDPRTGKTLAIPHENLCWTGAAYALAGVLTRSFRQTNWCTGIVGDARDGLDGGTVFDLPLYVHHTRGGNPLTVCPTETVIPGNREFALAEAGLLPLSYELHSDRAVFIGGKTLYQPTAAPGTPEHDNEFVASVLANVLPAARISHYLKQIGRRLHGRFTSAAKMQSFLHDWLANFKTDETADERGKTAYPLRNFKVAVTESGPPGVFDVSLELSFWTMVYRVNADVKLSAEIETTP